MARTQCVRRILLLTSDLGGGTGDHLLAMMNYWDKARWQPEIICEAPLTSRLVPNVPVKYVPPTGRLDRFPLAQPSRLSRIARHIKTRPPDVVHCYFFWSIMYGRVLKRLGMIRWLVENREDEGYDWNKFNYALLRRSCSLPDRVICVSEAIRKVVLEKEHIDPARVMVVHNGVEPLSNDPPDRLSARRELGVPDDALLVGMASNLNRPIKGVSYFLDAIPLILRSVPSVRFVILGTGSEELVLRDKARALGLESQVTFAGFRADIERFYHAMDLSVLTSLSEGLSITLLESMKHGLPVVVTDVGGNPEVVVDGKTGYLVPPRDAPAFADKVVALLRNRRLRDTMGAAARQRVKEKFQLRATATRYLQVYEELLMSDTNRAAERESR